MPIISGVRVFSSMSFFFAAANSFAFCVFLRFLAVFMALSNLADAARCAARSILRLRSMRVARRFFAALSIVGALALGAGAPATRFS